MIASHVLPARAARMAAASSTRSACTSYPAFSKRRTISAASLSESSTCRTRKISLMRHSFHRRRLLIQHQPVQTKLFDAMRELLEVHRLSYVAVYSEIISGREVLFLLGRCQDHDGQ